MPSLMVHLLAAHKFNADASIEFFIGNIAPDAVHEREKKDRTHLRDRVDRLRALTDMANAYDMNDDFISGVMLHLYLDYLWDADQQRKFIASYQGENWFIDYRKEIAIVSSWLYHNISWSNKLWSAMADYSGSLDGSICEVSSSDIEGLIIRNHRWHEENDLGPSSIYTPDFLEAFTDSAVRDYKMWLQSL